MDNNNFDLDESSTDDRIDAQRDLIRQSLDEIANDVGMMLRATGLTCPVFLTVWNSLVTVATPIDPPDEDWSRVIAIVSQIVEERIGTGKLGSRKLRCAMANAKMSAADVTTD